MTIPVYGYISNPTFQHQGIFDGIPMIHNKRSGALHGVIAIANTHKKMINKYIYI
jgi:hypothetical protein